MKRTVLFAAAFTLLIASAAPAEDKNVSIDFHFTATSPTTLEGTYTIAGAINESGLAESTVGTRVNDDGVLLLYANKVLHLQSGDVDLFVEGPLTFTGDTTIAMIGKWRLTGGTGAYADIKGHGTASVVGDLATLTFSGAYQGKVNVK